HGLLDEFEGIVDVAQRLLQVDDVDAVALGEDEALHLRVPTTGLMSEVNAAVEQLADGDDGHADALLSVHLKCFYVTRAPGSAFRIRCGLGSIRPAENVDDFFG